jgi:hypothetical protein
MSLNKSALIGAAILAGVGFAADAQAQYQPYVYPQPGNPYYRVPPGPPSWSYDPYTSGMTACPQRSQWDPPCSETLFPTYGQPNYRR